MSGTDECKALHTALIDAKMGYQEAVEDSDRPELTALFRDMLALRDRHHEELHALLRSGGETPDDSGSFMATVHKTVIGVRAAVTGLDKNSLSSFASGEEQIVDQYDKAITEAKGGAGEAILTRQKSELMSKIADMKRMAAA